MLGLGRRSMLALAIVFFLINFILVIIAIAGSTSNYNPLNNIYIFDADIKNVNVSKVIPQIAPLLTVLGTALSVPNATIDEVFGSLEAIANTTALAPLLTLLTDSNNVSATLDSLTNLAPLALSNSTAEVSGAISAVEALLNLSTNANSTFIGLEGIVSSTLSSTSDSDAAAQATVLELLSQSRNVTGSTQALMILNNLTLPQKASLLPVFSIVNQSKNQTVTFGSLVVIANATIPATLGNPLFASLANITSVTVLNATLTDLSIAAPADLKPAVQALSNIVTVSSDPLRTLGTLVNLYESNVTSAVWAKQSLASLSSLLSYASNTTEVVSAVQSLASNLNTTTTNAELASLNALFTSSSNSTQTLQYLISLSSMLATETTITGYVPYLFTLISSSSNPMKTISSLIEVVRWAAENTAVFEPIVALLAKANSVKEITQEELAFLTPKLLGYLHVPVHFRLALMSICSKQLEGSALVCKTSHPVQGLDFRAIIYVALTDSKFKPYLEALEIGENDLYLEGELLKRQHEYVPAMKATLAMCLLSIITSFFGMFLLAYVMYYRIDKLFHLFSIIAYVVFVSVFTGLAAAITAIIGDVLKSGTKHDNYGVVITDGSAFYGLMWTAFALTAVNCFIVFGVSVEHYRSIKAGTASDSDSDRAPFDDEKMTANIEVSDVSNSNVESDSISRISNQLLSNTGDEKDVVVEK